MASPPMRVGGAAMVRMVCVTVRRSVLVGAAWVAFFVVGCHDDNKGASGATPMVTATAAATTPPAEDTVSPRLATAGLEARYHVTSGSYVLAGVAQERIIITDPPKPTSYHLRLATNLPPGTPYRLTIQRKFVQRVQEDPQLKAMYTHAGEFTQKGDPIPLIQEGAARVTDDGWVDGVIQPFARDIQTLTRFDPTASDDWVPDDEHLRLTITAGPLAGETHRFELDIEAPLPE